MEREEKVHSVIMPHVTPPRAVEQGRRKKFNRKSNLRLKEKVSFVWHKKNALIGTENRILKNAIEK